MKRRSSLCTYKCSRKDVLKKHIAAVHEKKKPFECSLCPSKFDLKSELKYHAWKQHYEKLSKKRHLKCSLCQYTFDGKANLNRHIAAVHEKKKSFECSLCPYKIGSQCDLNKHIAAVHGEKKPFECALCPLSIQDWSQV